MKTLEKRKGDREKGIEKRCIGNDWVKPLLVNTLFSVVRAHVEL